MNLKEVQYWIGYYIDEYTFTEEIQAYYNFEDGFKEAIMDWNAECEEGNEIEKEEDIARVRDVAASFHFKTGWISISIIHAMIAQSF